MEWHFYIISGYESWQMDLLKNMVFSHLAAIQVQLLIMIFFLIQWANNT